MQFDYTDFIILTEKYLKKNLKICYIFNSVSTVTKRFQIVWHKLRFIPDITVKAENFWLATYRTFQDALLYDECLCVSTKQSKAKPERQEGTALCKVMSSGDTSLLQSAAQTG
jgi:hypothetical protein